MTPEEFRKAGYQLIDWLADYRTTVGERPVMSQVQPGEVMAKLPPSPPDQPEDFSAVIDDLDAIVLPGITHWQHPDYFAYFPSNATLASVLGDLVSSGLGVIGLNWQSSPALTEMEELVCDWVRQMVGLSQAWRGVIQDSASTSTLVALLCAREQGSDHSQARGGLQGFSSPLIVYCTEQSHSSVKKAALLAGFGLDNIRVIPTNEDYAMRADALEAAVEADRKAGAVPCAVVATVGTTATTALDPIDTIAQAASRHGLWLHVDAAMAGSAMILPECRWMWEGIEGADSIVINAHKWLGAVFDMSLFYVRDPQHLIRVMSTNPSYLRTAADGEAINYRDWGIPLGRRFRALKLWFMLREQGVSKLQARIRRDLAGTSWLREEVLDAPGWRILAPAPLQTLCVRHEPVGLSGDALDRYTLAWVDAINRSGKAFLTASQLDGRWMVRISMGAEMTTREDVARLWQTIRDQVAEMDPARFQQENQSGKQ
ncbi:MAG: aspartate aminotransferase family protein [Caldilineaceae bacterium]|nr:aspartate aminotransferase family protein [Caldilineaceae bacterium]